MPKGGRRLKMAPDTQLEAGPDSAEIVVHPTQPGFSIMCRNDGMIHEGNLATSPTAYRNTIWFCDDPDCQEAYTRRQKILRFRELQAAHGTPLPRDMGGPPTLTDSHGMRPNEDLDTLIPDTWVM